MTTLRVAAVLLAVLGTGLAAPAPHPGDDHTKPYIVTVRGGSPLSVLPPGVQARHIYLATLRGFAADLTPEQVRRLRRDPRVAAIEPDRRLGIAAVPWGLDRIDQRGSRLDGAYTPAGTGAGATVYVVDTGIETTHREFEGRARNVWDFEPANQGRDCLGHGTHVAGIIGARTYGVAKKVALRGVRVIGCAGYATYSSIIAGIEYVGTAPGDKTRSVVNLSLAGPKSAALDRALQGLVDRGVSVVAAAGNSAGDACELSPGGAANVITVAASDRTDTRAAFSGVGRCVEMYAPGVDIASTYIGGRTQAMSGTSMAAPHVAGVIALHLSTVSTASAASTRQWLRRLSTPNAVRSNPAGTANRLLYSGAR